MRDYTNYIESLENAGIRYTDEEWLKIINREAHDMEDTQAVKDIYYIVDCLARDGFVINRTVTFRG